MLFINSLFLLCFYKLYKLNVKNALFLAARISCKSVFLVTSHITKFFDAASLFQNIFSRCGFTKKCFYGRSSSPSPTTTISILFGRQIILSPDTDIFP